MHGWASMHPWSALFPQDTVRYLLAGARLRIAATYSPLQTASGNASSTIFSWPLQRAAFSSPRCKKMPRCRPGC
ncbi:hypothetical protein PXO_05744 [Xanthomonas oryzae pv. oryzae PXO99A]|uniref:Uncharacterized protein n=1 Tax=Xanthomonas oryzae pv. oryzae (strain PXO99A) TaxID=360094 RepID=A0A0K0GPS6_XANOP|nr:hypothetical protein PXO_05744 [Xanthomonas oryzae pv. oryzae PXO99A]